jgi:hypothetical protein
MIVIGGWLYLPPLFGASTVLVINLEGTEVIESAT